MLPCPTPLDLVAPMRRWCFRSIDEPEVSSFDRPLEKTTRSHGEAERWFRTH